MWIAEHLISTLMSYDFKNSAYYTLYKSALLYYFDIFALADPLKYKTIYYLNRQ